MNQSISYWIVPGLLRRGSVEAAAQIVRRVEQFAGVENLRERTRRREVCEARQVACFILRRDTDFSLERIGRLLGIDHSSVVHSIQVVKNLLDCDHQFQRDWGVFIGS